MNIIEEVFEYTQTIVKAIDVATEEQFILLIDKRDALVNFLETQPTLSDAEKEKLKLFSNFDKLIRDKMEDMMSASNTELEKIRNAKTQRKGYEASYSVGSYFIDDKK